MDRDQEQGLYYCPTCDKGPFYTPSAMCSGVYRQGRKDEHERVQVIPERERQQ